MIKSFILSFILISTTLLAGPREEVEIILSRYHAETKVSRRLDVISKNFLGLPYGNGPLGEGPDGRYDQDPLYRLDTFDCTTYVETMMAFAMSRSISEFEVILDKIRYKDGEVDYLKRNHFTDLQWIPFNVENGFMSEINTLVVDSSEIKIAQALINYPGWLKSIKIDQIVVPMASPNERKILLEELQAEAVNFEPQIASVPYIPIKTIISRPELLKKVPSGTVVNFVRPNWDLTDLIGTHQNISHQGFLFRFNNGLYLRHASTTGKVEEILFYDYLKKFQNHATLKGIHLMQVNP
jgi:hypothetical protein